jgi:hypothetical protein
MFNSCSQQSTTKSYSEPSEFTPHYHSLCLSSMLLLSSHLQPCPPGSILYAGFLITILLAFLAYHTGTACPVNWNILFEFTLFSFVFLEVCTIRQEAASTSEHESYVQV